MRWGLVSLILQFLFSCHMHPVFANSKVQCSFQANLQGDSSQSILSGANTWKGHGKVHCFSLNGSVTAYNVSGCLTSWTSSDTYIVLNSDISLNALFGFESQEDLFSPMELQLQEQYPLQKENKLIGWPGIENHEINADVSNPEQSLSSLNSSTLILSPNRQINCSAGPFN